MPLSDKSRIDQKLHCIFCGTKRQMRLSLPFPREDGQTGMAFIKIKNLLKMIKENKLPNQKGLAFPRKDLMATCSTCYNTSFFDINNSGKLVARC
jgi:hypothetical protein